MKKILSALILCSVLAAMQFVQAQDARPELNEATRLNYSRSLYFSISKGRYEEALKILEDHPKVIDLNIKKESNSLIPLIKAYPEAKEDVKKLQLWHQLFDKLLRARWDVIEMSRRIDFSIVDRETNDDILILAAKYLDDNLILPLLERANSPEVVSHTNKNKRNVYIYLAKLKKVKSLEYLLNRFKTSEAPLVQDHGKVNMMFYLLNSELNADSESEAKSKENGLFLSSTDTSQEEIEAVAIRYLKQYPHLLHSKVGWKDPALPTTLLQLSAKNSHLKVMDYILSEDNVEVDYRVDEKKGYTALMFAARYNNAESVKKLLKNKADPTLTDEHLNNSLHMASVSGNVDSIKYILDSVPELLNSKNKQNNQPLHLALLFKQVDVAKELLVRPGINLTSKNDKGETPFVLAAKLGDESVLESFISSDSAYNLNDKDRSGISALVYISKYKNDDLFKRLVDKALSNNIESLDFTMVDEEGNSLAHILAQKGMFDLLKKLLDKRPELLHALNSNRRTLFQVALEKGHIDMANYLLDKLSPEDLDHMDKYGRATVNDAISAGDVGILKRLQKIKGNQYFTSHKDRPSLMFATYMKKPSSVEFLLELDNIDVNEQDQDGDTALKYAVRYQQYEIIEMLLEANPPADPFLASNDGLTPVSEAMDLDEIDVLRMFFEKHKDKLNEALFLAITREESDEVIDLLLEMGAEPTAISGQGKSTGFNIVNWAAKIGHEYILDLFKNSSRPDVNQLSPENLSALHYLINAEDTDMLEVFLESEFVNVNLFSATNISAEKSLIPLIFALERKSDDEQVILTLLARSDIELNVRDLLGNSALVLALKKEFSGVALDIVIRCPKCIDKKAIKLAYEYGMVDVIKVLIAKGYKPTKENLSLALKSAAGKTYEFWQSLIELGVELSVIKNLMGKYNFTWKDDFFKSASQTIEHCREQYKKRGRSLEQLPKTSCINVELLNELAGVKLIGPEENEEEGHEANSLSK